MDVGSALRSARERRGRSLEQVAQTTRIRVPILRAIEANSRDQLPPTIYLRAFVRAYASEVGLDPDEIAARYIDQFQPVVDPRAEATAIAVENPWWKWPPTLAVGSERRIALMQWLAIIVVVASLGGYTLLRAPEPGERTAAEASRSDRDTDAAAPPAAGPSPRTEIGTSGAGGRPGSGPMRLEMRIGGACWVTASADGKREVYRLMQPGETYELRAERDIVLRIGDPAAFAFSIDGVEGRTLGSPERPVTARITRENYREFLQH